MGAAEEVLPGCSICLFVFILSMLLFVSVFLFEVLPNRVSARPRFELVYAVAVCNLPVLPQRMKEALCQFAERLLARQSVERDLSFQILPKSPRRNVASVAAGFPLSCSFAGCLSSSVADRDKPPA